MLIDKDGREATPPDWYKDQYGNIEYREDKSVESWTEHFCTFEIDKNRNLTPIGYEERYWSKINSPLQVAERNSGCGLPAPSLGVYVQGIQKGAEISTRNFLLKNYRKLISNGKNLELLILFTVQKTGKL